MSNPDVLGWLAAGLMVATFGCREAGAMRPLAVATNLAFIGYGLAASLAPVLTLHLLLLPINLWRWAEVLRTKESFVKLVNLLQRSAPALTLAACVVLSACGGGGGSASAPAPTTPPVQLTEIWRKWGVSEIRANGRSIQLLETNETDQNIDVSVDREVDGGLAFVPPEYPGKSRPQAGVFSRPGGMTFGAYADAPGLSRLNGDDAVGSGSLLVQEQAFRKNAADATLEFVVSFAWIDLIDENTGPPTDTECSWQSGGSVVECDRVMNAWVSYSLTGKADADGAPDTSFGSNGTRTFDLSTNWDEATAIAVQPDGKLVLAVAYSDAGNFAFGALRLTTGGERDATFGSNGFVFRHIGSGSDSPTAIVLQSDGRILLGGYAVNATTSFDIALAGFNTNGTTDSSFGTSGSQVFDLFNSADGANDLLLQADGRLVAAGSARNGANLLPLLLRLVP